MLNGLDLFSGIAGLTLALSPWVRPIAYCEIDRYAQSVLLSRMSNGEIPKAPIWDDVRTLGRQHFDLPVDIITGGFPCQDISVAGSGAGLEGERSGLYFEIHRLVGELNPGFIFLENVPAITTRGGVQVAESLTTLGYDCRWTILSASAVGANHRRERWFLLAHHNSQRRKIVSTDKGEKQSSLERGGLISNTQCQRLQKPWGDSRGQEESRPADQPFSSSWWAVEPNVGRVAHGVPFRVDRIKGLGNAVVPIQARAAFEILLFGESDLVA